MRRSISRGRHPDDALEVAGELALIVKTNVRRELRGTHALTEQVSRALHAEVREVCMWRQANLSAEGAAQVKFVERRIVGQIV